MQTQHAVRTPNKSFIPLAAFNGKFSDLKAFDEAERRKDRLAAEARMPQKLYVFKAVTEHEQHVFAVFAPNYKHAVKCLEAAKDRRKVEVFETSDVAIRRDKQIQLGGWDPLQAQVWFLLQTKEPKIGQSISFDDWG